MARRRQRKPDEYRLAKILAREDGQDWDHMTTIEVRRYLTMAHDELTKPACTWVELSLPDSSLISVVEAGRVRLPAEESVSQAGILAFLSPVDPDDLPLCVWGISPGLPPTAKPIGKGAKIPVRGHERNAVRQPAGNSPAKGIEYANRAGILHASNGQKRCPECWKVKAFPADFDGRQMCNACREHRRLVDAAKASAR